MKRIVTFLLIVTLVCSLSISAFASDSWEYNGVTYPAYTTTDDKPYLFIAVNNGVTYLYHTEKKPYYDGSVKTDSGSYVQYKLINGVQWQRWNTSTSFAVNEANVVWSLTNIYSLDGSLILKGYDPYYVYVECDGTSCPANDIDHDNVCDDCGNVLTFSLRSTLLDYAKSLAETNSAFSSTHTYYAVVEHPTDSDKYVLYISQIQMGTTDGGTSVTGGDMYRCIVVTRDDGSFANQGFGAVDSWSGKVVYANHTIPFFFRVPLKVTVQGPTGEQMEMEAPNLTKEFSTLALCGIGCLALLVLLRLLSNSFRKISQRT